MSKYITLTLRIRENEKAAEKENIKEVRLSHDVDGTVLHTMREGGITLPSFCGNRGKCGRCLVRFDGYAPFPTQTDRVLLAADMLREGYRLACMAKPVKDCVVETAFPKERNMDIVTAGLTRTHSGEKALGSFGEKAGMVTGNDSAADSFLEDTDSADTIIAVDIGTTTIAMQLVEAATGAVLDTYTCLNPQRSYGTDVLARIREACQGEAEVLKQVLEEALNKGKNQFENYRKKYGLCKPERAVIACNTTMGHLFRGYSVEKLGKSPFIPISLKAERFLWENRGDVTEAVDKAEGADTADMTDTADATEAVLLPGISAFVGGDIVAGLYACGLCGVPKKGEESARETQEKQALQDTWLAQGKFANQDAWLFLDLGTNAEMVLGIGEHLIATAAAAGSAFEGRGEANAYGAERIAALALLLEEGMADGTGLLKEPYFENGVTVGTVQITQEDIRDIQMAKAAVRTGIHFLLEKSGLSGYEQLAKVYIAGGMGFYLEKEAAVRIGLLPKELETKIEAVGNTSLAGAAAIGRNGADMAALEEAAAKTEVFNLAEQEDFGDIYISYMNFDVIE